MASPSKEPEPLSESLSGDELLEKASAALNPAKAAQDEASLSAAAGQVTPQVLFSALDAASFKATVSVFDVRFVPASVALVDEGSVGNEAFVVARGELDVSKRPSNPGGTPL